MRSYTRWLLLVAGLLVVPAVQGQAPAEPNALLDKILQDWRTRQQRTKNVLYKTTGTTVFPKGRFTGDPDLPQSVRDETIPKEDHVAEVKYTWLIDFQNNRIRKESSNLGFSYKKQDFFPVFAVEAFDGQQHNVLSPKPSGVDYSSIIWPEFIIQRKDYSFLSTADYPVFLAHGVSLLAGQNSLKNLRVPINPKDYYYQGKGEIEGRECVVLRTPLRVRCYDELWVDLQRDSAICRWILTCSGHTALHADVWHKESGGTWLPSRWKMTTYYPPSSGKIEQSISLEVTDIILNQNLALKDFLVKPEAGMVVRDANLQKSYRVADDGTLIEISESLKEEGRGWSSYIVATLVCGLVAILGWTLFRRWRSKH